MTEPETLSKEMISFLEEQKLEAEIQATIDAAIEIGLSNFTRADAIQTLLEQEREKNVGDEG